MAANVSYPANNCGSPELRVDKAIEIDEGEALFDIDAEKNETLLGVYDGETWILTAEGKKWLAERSNEDA